jgi:hypothetical protein
VQEGPIAGETRRVRKRTLRSRITPSDVFASANWITKRDRQICLDLYKHHVLTVHQLARLHFPQPRKARNRLLQLYERGVLNRFQPRRRSGSAPFHYVLGELGAHIVAGYYDLDLRRIKGRIVEDQKLAHSAKLDHLLECHDFFIALLTSCRDNHGHRLPRWWSEKRCELEWSGETGKPWVRPDGQGILQGPNGRCSFILELDRGTEGGNRLEEKSDGYSHIAYLNDLDRDAERRPSVDALLFLFPSAERERSARTHLVAYRGLPVATSHRAPHENDPLGANWTPTDRSETEARLSLYELPGLGEEERDRKE